MSNKLNKFLSMILVVVTLVVFTCVIVDADWNSINTIVQTGTTAGTNVIISGVNDYTVDTNLSTNISIVNDHELNFNVDGLYPNGEAYFKIKQENVGDSDVIFNEVIVDLTLLDESIKNNLYYEIQFWKEDEFGILIGTKTSVEIITLIDLKTSVDTILNGMILQSGEKLVIGGVNTGGQGAALGMYETAGNDTQGRTIDFIFDIKWIQSL